nr:hypothetical protein Iba_chr07cCG6240 [Ipomoea batatas]
MTLLRRKWIRFTLRTDMHNLEGSDSGSEMAGTSDVVAIWSSTVGSVSSGSFNNVTLVPARTMARLRKTSALNP